MFGARRSTLNNAGSFKLQRTLNCLSKRNGIFTIGKRRGGERINRDNKRGSYSNLQKINLTIHMDSLIIKCFPDR